MRRIAVAHDAVTQSTLGTIVAGKKGYPPHRCDDPQHDPEQSAGLREALLRSDDRARSLETHPGTKSLLRICFPRRYAYFCND